jgi:DNA-binding transcriptional regulator LsrR (DeoR family)
VSIEIEVPDPIELSLSDRLRSTYGLNNALVLRRVPGEDSPALRRRLAELAADLLSEIVVPGDVLGLAWARTVNVMVESLTRLARCTVVQLCGVHSRMDMRDSSVETVARAAAISGGAAYPIYAPLVLPDGRTGETLRRQHGIAEAFDAFGSLTKAVVSVGAWQPDQSTVYDVIENERREELARDGVTAEMSAQLFDAGGRVLSTGLRHHVLAIDAEQLRRVPEVVALAGGDAKVAAIDAVLRSGIVTTMITDADAAEGLLERAAADPPSSRAVDRIPPGER